MRYCIRAPHSSGSTVMPMCRQSAWMLSLMLSGAAAGAYGQEPWPPNDAPVAMPQGQPAAQPPTSLIEAGRLLTGRGQELHDTRILVTGGKVVAIGRDLTARGAVIYD